MQRITSNLLSEIWATLKGKKQNYTELHLGKAIILLAIPMVLEMVMESIFVVVDIYFISKISSESSNAIATVGLTESMMSVVFAICIGLSMATTAVVSRRIGENRPERAKIATAQSITISIFLAAIISVAGVYFAKDLLRLMGATEAMIETGWEYTTIMFGCNVIIMLLFVINAALRGAGDAMRSMTVLWLANGLNIILDPCLIFGWGIFPELGVKGAAIATNIGRGMAVLYQFYILFRGSKLLKIKPEHFVLKFRVIKQILFTAFGGIWQRLIVILSWIVLMRIISTFGPHVIAGYTITIRILIFTILPAWGLSNAAATLVGQNLGAGKPDRAERSVWITGFICMAFMGFIAIFYISSPDYFIQIFTHEKAVVDSGAIALRYIASGYLFFALGMVVIQSFNGAGDTLTPTLINIVSFWLIEIPLAYLLAKNLGYGVQGVYIAILVAEASMTILGVIMFKRGRWKLKKV